MPFIFLDTEEMEVLSIFVRQIAWWDDAMGKKLLRKFNQAEEVILVDKKKPKAKSKVLKKTKIKGDINKAGGTKKKKK